MSEVGQDLLGRVVVVTGATGGMGRVLCREVATRGARVVALGRDATRLNGLRAELQLLRPPVEPVVVVADLATTTGIASAARDVRALGPEVDVLLNNAGAHFAERHVSRDGLEMHVAVDYLPAVGMATLLAQELDRAQGRVVNVVSDTLRDARKLTFVGRARPPHVVREDLADLRSVNPARGYRAFEAYARAKLLTAMATVELARRWADRGVTVNAVHPGIVATGIVDGLVPAPLRPLRSAIRSLMLTPEQGAAPALRLALDPGLVGLTGRYFVRDEDTDLPSVVEDTTARELLLATTERLLGGDPASVAPAPRQ